MTKKRSSIDALLLRQAQHSLSKHHLPRILDCLRELSAKQIWWRGNKASNSIGNLVLHLSGNVHQWIISGLGGAPDVRERDKEFDERGPLPRRETENRLKKTVLEACRVISRLTSRDLHRRYMIQGFDVTGFEALSHVTEHFAYHSGQILYATKLLQARDLGFTRLPGDKKKTTRKKLPVL